MHIRYSKQACLCSIHNVPGTPSAASKAECGSWGSFSEGGNEEKEEEEGILNLNISGQCAVACTSDEPFVHASHGPGASTRISFPALGSHYQYFPTCTGPPCYTLQYLDFRPTVLMCISQPARLFVERGIVTRVLAAGKALMSLSLGLDRQPTSLAVKKQSAWSEDLDYFSHLLIPAGICLDIRQSIM
ncbi:hypothetical protein TgHK011_007521 [Trichoderma gracile]|nr:hypothetical protein TgHK011_007521 [Trichoderma gracile]